MIAQRHITKIFKGWTSLLFVVFLPYVVYASSDLSQSIVQTSAQFLDKPYHFNALGEGATGKFDQHPLYRFDQFDCESYVETVMALVLAQAKHQPFIEVLKKIRYQQGKVDFITRNHFPEINWLPENIQQGWIEDITNKITLPSQRITQAVTINVPGWYQHLTLQRIYLPGASVATIQQRLFQLQQFSKIKKPQTVDLTYLRLSALSQIINKIPQGSIVLIVAPTSIKISQQLGTTLWISHMGFAIWKNHILYFRAASSLHKKVIDIPLLRYFESVKGVQGLIFLVIKN